MHAVHLPGTDVRNCCDTMLEPYEYAGRRRRVPAETIHGGVVVSG